MSSLSHVHVEVAIKDEFAAARRQSEALHTPASGQNRVASGLSREGVEGGLGLVLCRFVSAHMGLTGSCPPSVSFFPYFFFDPSTGGPSVFLNCPAILARSAC